LGRIWKSHFARVERADVVGLLPATMVNADMAPDDRGTWLFHCHVNDHILAGMSARYRVE
jgi:FtsP/CotA-like multicopper oxidase with cupredoxin domain